MMDDRIKSSLNFLCDDASFICHIDENEYENLWNLFQNKGLFNLGTVVWDKRNPMTGGSGIATQHEYMTWFSPSNITISINTDNASDMLNKVNELIEKYGTVTSDVRKEYVTWINSNTKLSGGDKAYRHITDDGRIFQSVSLRAPEPRENAKFQSFSGREKEEERQKCHPSFAALRLRDKDTKSRPMLQSHTRIGRQNSKGQSGKHKKTGKRTAIWNLFMTM